MVKDPRTDADMRSVIHDYAWITPKDENDQPVDSIRIKYMGQDPVDKGCYTRLIVMEPGFDSRKLENVPEGFGKHDYWKEDLILEGTLIDCGENQIYTKGYYGLFEPNSTHGPYETKSGCTILETTWYDKKWYDANPRKDS